MNYPSKGVAFSQSLQKEIGQENPPSFHDGKAFLAYYVYC